MGKAERRRAVFGFVVLLSERSLARSWRDIELVQDIKPIDTSALFYLNLEELRFRSKVDGSESPLVSEPSRMVPEDVPPSTNRPSPSPSKSPSAPPTAKPTSSPTRHPTETPTTAPSIAPTLDPYKNHEPPSNPEKWYFNYDGSSNHGPGEMALVQESNGFFQVDIKNDHWGQATRPPNDYWTEFTDAGFGPWKSILEIHKPERNMCETGKMQSPIDIRENGAICREEHEVRSLPGDFQVTGQHVEKRIESNKLRLVYERRPCADLTNTKCQEPDPPSADFPNGWGGFADVMHIDFKVQSEHTISSEKFDGEMQIFNLHPGRRRLAAQSVLIRAQTGGYNYYFQEALDAFQEQYDRNAASCGRRLREARQAVSDVHRTLGSNVTSPFVDYLSWARLSTGNDFENMMNTDGRKKYDDHAWDPYHEMLIPTIYFYRYEGSLTEPPCGEFVSWWIADKPMIISVEQLEQLKTILFTNVDGNCKKTSVQFGRSVARPIRKTNNRAVWKCTADNFGPDIG